MDELSPEARAILSEMRQADAPRDGARERVRRQLLLSVGAATLSVAGSAEAARNAALLGGAGTAAAQGAGTAVATGLAGVSLGKLALLVLAGALGGGAVLTPVALLREPSASGAPRSALRAERATEPQQVPAEPRRALVSVPAPAPLSSAELVSVRVATPARRAEPPPSGSTASSELGSETRLLAAVREQLQAGHATQSLALLEQHQQRYPHGVLREEAAASRVFALCALGRTCEAEAQRAAFQAAFPRSPLGPRVARACPSSAHFQ
ncbi:MAG: hypothetical protein QM756_44095 [Polyangiaceae bacterium]